MREKIAYVVPTKDRRDDLKKLLDSLEKQRALPAQVVIVDGSDKPVEDLVRQYPGLPLRYVREYPPSLARQRNAGMAALSDEITIAGYLDDDVELEPDATENMLRYWARASPQVGGAAFTIINQPLRHPVFGLFSQLFMLNGSEQGRVLPSGFGTSIVPQPHNSKTEWLYGGATLWRREVIRRFGYDEWYIGHGFLEDLDYSYRVSREYELWVVADAKVWHWPKPILMAQNSNLGRQQVVNRIYFTRKTGNFSTMPVVWALCGQGLHNLLDAVAKLSPAGLYRLQGNFVGLADIARGRLQPVEGIWK
jgi:GT2 family glycosyltransferase